MKESIIFINSDFIKLDQLLKLGGVVGSGSEAKFLIAAGKILVNAEIEWRRGRKISDGDKVATPEICFIIKKEGPRN